MYDKKSKISFSMLYLAPDKQRGRPEAAPNDSNHDGSHAHATGSGQCRQESRECSYNYLRNEFYYSFLVHDTRFKG